MLCEYRSDNEKCLAEMQSKFKKIFTDATARGLDVRITPVGERPCMGDVDLAKIQRLVKVCSNVIEDVVDVKVETCSISTDCNIPLSLGIPAICIGVYNGGGTHTREEWIEKDSLPIGVEVGIRVVIDVLKEI